MLICGKDFRILNLLERFSNVSRGLLESMFSTNSCRRALSNHKGDVFSTNHIQNRSQSEFESGVISGPSLTVTCLKRHLIG